MNVPLTRSRSIVVVGNGMVGHRFCERLAELDENRLFRVTVLGEEARVAYDRVHLTSYLEAAVPGALALADQDWYRARGIDLRLGRSAVSLDLARRQVGTGAGEWLAFDELVLATGSRPFVPPIPGIDQEGVFVYRTIDDLDAIRTRSTSARVAAVLGGGLLGLEAAKALHDLGLETHVIETNDRLMPRQLDQAGARLLRRSVEALGVHVHLGQLTTAVLGGGEVTGLELADGTQLEVQLLVVSAGIRPRDELARDAGLVLGERGGIMVDDKLTASAPGVYAIGECASHHGLCYGLVAPGYEMADVLARRLVGEQVEFAGADQSTQLKLLGVDVASFGNPFAEAETGRSIVYEDLVNGVYKKLVLSDDCSRLVGGVLVGDAACYVQLAGLARSGEPLPVSAEELVVGSRTGTLELGDSAQICSCNNVTQGAVCAAVASGCATIGEVKGATRAGTGCGGCLPQVTDLLQRELRRTGRATQPRLCEHFPFTRGELFQIVAATRLRSFEALLASHGSGSGCEICKPTIASILASVHNDCVVDHDTIQDTNDRYLANIQRGGLYSVVPRIPGGEITPDQLIVIGEVAKRFGLYTKITGGQRIDLFGARLDQLPDIWEVLVEAGFESGHAYGKAMRTVKSCVGSTWCRFGVQDSVGFAIRIEERYKGIRAPHKLKSAVSGCVRECAEARCKDFGLIATERGYNIYVGGNGGTTPRHAELLATDVDEATAIAYLDRFLMFYIRTADKLTRTAKWLEQLDGGIEKLRAIVIDDTLGIAAELERDMQALVASFQCEWAAVVRDPERRAKFRHFAEQGGKDPTVRLVAQRGQRRPADWPARSVPNRRHSLPVVATSWVRVATATDVPREGGITVRHGQAQIAVFHLASRGRWYATQARCPHKGDMVLGRGIVGDAGGEPKVACPHHKRCFSLETGASLTGDDFGILTFPVKVERGEVYLDLPSAAELETMVAAAPSCELETQPEEIIAAE